MDDIVYLLIKAVDWALPSMPKFVPHMVDWTAAIPGGIGILEVPSGVRLGMRTKVEQAVGADPPPPAAVVGEMKSKGSGEVVDDSFHCILQ